MVRKTRKQNKVMTIPQLRKAFEHMDKVRGVENFRKEWKKTFGKEITIQSAEDYLQYVAAKKPGVQHGGMAPLDYTLRAGTDLPYGSYPSYVASGFGFANQDSLLAQCGKETSLWPSGTAGCAAAKGGGRKKNKTRKQKGGAFPSLSTALSEFMSRPMGMDAPPNAAQAATMEWKGTAMPSSDPVNNPLSYTVPPTIHAASINPISRTF
jgi:hypothetical protein